MSTAKRKLRFGELPPGKRPAPVDGHVTTKDGFALVHTGGDPMAAGSVWHTRAVVKEPAQLVGKRKHRDGVEYFVLRTADGSYVMQTAIDVTGKK